MCDFTSIMINTVRCHLREQRAPLMCGVHCTRQLTHLSKGGGANAPHCLSAVKNKPVCFFKSLAIGQQPCLNVLLYVKTSQRRFPSLEIHRLTRRLKASRHGSTGFRKTSIVRSVVSVTVKGQNHCRRQLGHERDKTRDKRRS